MYPKQYVIASSAERLPPDYIPYRLGAWFVGVAADLAVRELTADNFRGFLIGHPIDIEPGDDDPADVEDLLRRFAGSFIAVVEVDGETRIYLDASGLLPAVYSPQHGIVTANVDLIAEVPYDRELQRQIPIEKGCFFPFGLTPKTGVLRLLPNHTLSLNSWTVRRHWPDRLGSGQESVEGNIRTITDRMSTAIMALASTRSTTLGLTAGRDSRALLACATPIMHGLSYFTAVFDERSRWDARIAARMADKLRLSHTVADFVPPTETERNEWLASTGHSVGGAVSRNFRTIARPTRGLAVIMGLGGEVGRAFYGDGIEPTTRVDASLLLKKLRVPDTAVARGAAEAWLRGLPPLDAQQIMDLLYIEQRLGCWAGPQLIAAGPAKFRIAPFSQRIVFERMLDTPYEFRRKHRIQTDVVRLANPSLLALPNKRAESGFRRLARAAARRWSVPRAILSGDRAG